MANRDVIDAGEEFDRIEGERGASRLGEQRKPSPQGAKLFLVVIIAAVLGAGGFVTWKAMGIMEKGDGGESQAVEPQIGLNKAGADWQPKPIIPEPEPQAADEAEAAAAVASANAAAPAQVAAPPQQQRPEGPSPEDLIRMRRLSPNLNTNTGGQQNQAQAQPTTEPSSGSGSGPLADNLQPVRLSGARAGVLKNRDMLLTQGSMLDCQLETKIVSTVPGMTTWCSPRQRG